MLGPWLGTAVNFCKKAEQVAEQGGTGFSHELAFMLNLVSQEDPQCKECNCFPFEVSGWDPLGGLSFRQPVTLVNTSIRVYSLVGAPEATRSLLIPKCTDSEVLTPTGLIQAAALVKSGTEV